MMCQFFENGNGDLIHAVAEDDLFQHACTGTERRITDGFEMFPGGQRGFINFRIPLVHGKFRTEKRDCQHVFAFLHRQHQIVGTALPEAAAGGGKTAFKEHFSIDRDLHAERTCTAMQQHISGAI